MLQIIGWLGCVYLLVKGLELVSSNAHRTPEGRLHGAATLGAVLAFLGAIGFFFVLNAQVSATSSALSTSFGTFGSNTSPLDNASDEQLNQLADQAEKDAQNAQAAAKAVRASR